MTFFNTPFVLFDWYNIKIKLSINGLQNVFYLFVVDNKEQVFDFVLVVVVLSLDKYTSP